MLLRTTPTGTRTTAPRRRGFVIVAVLMVVTVLSLAAYQYSSLDGRRGDGRRGASARRPRPRPWPSPASTRPWPSWPTRTPSRGSSTATRTTTPGPSRRSWSRRASRPGRTGGSRSSRSTTGRTRRPGRSRCGTGSSDEGGKLNVNALFALDSSGQGAPRRPDEAPEHDRRDRLVDRGLDRPGRGAQRRRGRERVLFATLPHPYQCKNAPLDTIEELLLVKGVTPGAAVRHRPEPQRQARPGRGRRMGFTPGWAAYLTVYSRERNVDADGNPRINLNGNDLTQLQSEPDRTARPGPDHVHSGLPPLRQRVVRPGPARQGRGTPGGPSRGR